MSSISTAYAKCNSLPTSIGWIVNHQLVEYQDEDLIFLCHHTYSMVKGCVKALSAHAFKGNHFYLAKTNACELLESKCDRIIIKDLGEGAGLHSSANKKSGSLVEAAISQLEIDLKKLKRNSLESLAEVIDLFAGARTYEFLMKFIPSFITTQNDKKPEEKVKIVADLMQRFVQTWSTVLRASPVQKLSTDSNGEFLDILFGNSFEIIACINHLTWMARKGHCNKMSNDAEAMAAEQAAKFSALRNRLEAFFCSQFGNQGKNNKDSYKSSGNNDWKVDDARNYDVSVRTCRAGIISSCAESIIDDKDKYVQFRCDQGCISSLHKSCFQSLQGSLESDDAGRLKCINSMEPSRENQDERKVSQLKRCEGLVFAILLNKDTKMLAIAAGSENFNPSDCDSLQSFADAVDSFSTDRVCDAKIREAIKACSKVKPIKYVLLKQLQSEKEQVELKKRQVALLESAVDEKDVSPKQTSPVAPNKSKKPFAIEVVLPLVKSKPPSAPASAASSSSSTCWSSSSSSSSCVPQLASPASASASAAIPVMVKLNSFTPSKTTSPLLHAFAESKQESNSNTELKDEWQVVPSKSKRSLSSQLAAYNYAATSQIATAVPSSNSLSSNSLFPVTVKKSKTNASSKGKTASQLNAEEQKAIDFAIARSLRDADHEQYVSNGVANGLPQAIPIPASHQVKSQVATSKPAPTVLEPPTASNSIVSHLFPTKRMASRNSTVEFPSLPTNPNAVSASSSVIASSSSSAFKSVQKLPSYASPFTASLIQSAVSASNMKNQTTPSSISGVVSSESAEGIANHSEVEDHVRQEGESEPGADLASTPAIPGGCVERNQTSITTEQSLRQEELKSKEECPLVDANVSSVASFNAPTSPLSNQSTLASAGTPSNVSSSSISPTPSHAVSVNNFSFNLASARSAKIEQPLSNHVESAFSVAQPVARLSNSLPMDDSNQQPPTSMPIATILPFVALSTPAGSPDAPLTALQPGAPAAAGTQLQLVHSVATSLNNIQTPVLVLRHLPLPILPQQLGALFVQFGKVNVRLFLEYGHQSNHHGHSLSHLTAVLSYQCIEHAANAFQQFNNKTFEIDSSDGDMDYFQMQMQFGCFPVDIVKMPQTKFRLIQ